MKDNNNSKMENFVLKEENKKSIIGYAWDIENPTKVVCIIHGIGEYAKRYNRMAKKFNEAGYAVFSMDLRGHGQSFGKRGHCAPRESVLEDINDLIDYARVQHPNVPFVLYGHSMGGNITLDYRNRGKYNGDITGYVVSAPWVKLVRKVPKYQYVFMTGLSHIMPQFKISSAIDESALGNKANVAGYSKDKYVHNYISAACAVAGFNIGNALYDDTHIIKGDGRKRPMLLMHGNKDVICSVEGSRQISKNQADTCEYVEWPGLYHEIHNGGEHSRGTEVIEKAIDWIGKL